MELLIKLVLSILFVAAFVTLNFAVFKLPIKGQDKQIAVLALVVGGVNFYFKFVTDSQYFLLLQTLTYIILLAALRRYPLLFSCMVVIGGSIVGSFLDVGVSYAAVGLKLSDFDLMLNNLTHFTVFHLAQTAIYFLIASLLVKFKIGLNLIKYKYKFYVIEKFNVLWMILVVSVISVLTYSSQNFKTHSSHGLILTLLALGLIIFLAYGYFQTKKDQKSREEAFKN